MIDPAAPPRCIVCGAAHATCTATVTTIPPLEGTLMASEQDKRRLDDDIASATEYLNSAQRPEDAGFLKGAEDRLADLKRQRQHIDDVTRPAEVKPVTSDAAPAAPKARRSAPEDKAQRAGEDKAPVTRRRRVSRKEG